LTFIVGTPNEGGRCSSHPHRSLQLPRPKRKLSRSVKDAGSPGQVAQGNNSFVNVPNGPSNQIQVLALQSNVLSLEALHHSEDGPSKSPSLLDYLPDLIKSSPALETALRALCLIHMGVTKKEQRLIRESAVLNTQALSKVRLAMTNTRSATKIETLAASICLFLYEVGSP
jgi:hypothetical protein